MRAAVAKIRVVVAAQREEASLATFVTLEEPDRPMTAEAVLAAFYCSPGSNQDYRKIWIILVDPEMIEDKYAISSLWCRVDPDVHFIVLSSKLSLEEGLHAIRRECNRMIEESFGHRKHVDSAYPRQEKEIASRPASPDKQAYALSYTDAQIGRYEEAKRWGRAFCRQCGYCLPCSEEINIPHIMRLLMQWHHEGNGKLMEQYSKLPIKASACTACGTCEERCPYDLPVAEKMEEAQQVFEPTK